MACVQWLMARFAETFAMSLDEAREHMSTGDLIVSAFEWRASGPVCGGEAAIIVEGEFQRLFAWTLGASGVARLIELDEYVASIGNLAVVRRLDVRAPSAHGDAEQLASRLADTIETIIARPPLAHLLAADLPAERVPTPAMLVVYTYIRMQLARDRKPLGLYDTEDLLLDGDFDEALDDGVRLRRDAYIVRRRPTAS